MALYLRLTVILLFSSMVLPPTAGFAAKCKNKLYIISLKDSYLKNKYKVRSFFLYPSNYIYGVPKMPKGWLYDFPDEHGTETLLIGTADTDKEAVDIGYFKDFLTIVVRTDADHNKKPYFSMTLFCNKPNGTATILDLQNKDFKIKRIHKCLKRY
ncbi:hypothetical protein [Candidatus Magnetominusculus dajiuhuensis]|uniref:hypothetical protein n=1 Tax=Candidatus Magnetominusculus dajiuhuensis TaxID=3137712 RepID=UPI003B438EA0